MVLRPVTGLSMALEPWFWRRQLPSAQHVFVLLKSLYLIFRISSQVMSSDVKWCQVMSTTSPKIYTTTSMTHLGQSPKNKKKIARYFIGHMASSAMNCTEASQPFVGGQMVIYIFVHTICVASQKSMKTYVYHNLDKLCPGFILHLQITLLCFFHVITVGSCSLPFFCYFVGRVWTDLILFHVWLHADESLEICPHRYNCFRILTYLTCVFQVSESYRVSCLFLIWSLRLFWWSPHTKTAVSLFHGANCQNLGSTTQHHPTAVEACPMTTYPDNFQVPQRSKF